MRLKSHSTLIVTLIAGSLCCGPLSAEPAQTSSAARTIPAKTAPTPAQNAEAKVATARATLAAYAKERALFNEKLAGELFRAEFSKSDESRDESRMEEALTYCWLVSKNPKRLAEARKNLFDVSRMGQARLRSLDKAHIERVQEISRYVYRPADSYYRDDKPSETDMWLTAAARAANERDVSPLLDRLSAALPQPKNEYEYGRSRNVIILAGLILPYRDDETIMAAYEKMLKNSTDLEELVTQLEYGKKRFPDSFRDQILKSADTQRFAVDYAAVSSEVVSLPVKAYLPDFDAALGKLGYDAVPDKPSSDQAASPAPAEGEQANGLMVAKLPETPGPELLSRFGDKAFVFFPLTEDALSAYRQQYDDNRRAIFPLFAGTPLAPFMGDKEGVQHIGPLGNIISLLEGDPTPGYMDDRIYYIVGGESVEAAGQAFAANLTWLGVACSDREARLIGKADRLADLSTNAFARDYGRKNTTSSAFVDTEKQVPRLVRAASSVYFLTMAERATPEQLAALFGPIDGVLMREPGAKNWLLFTLKEKPQTATARRLGEAKPLALGPEFLRALAQRELATLDQSFARYLTRTRDGKAQLDALNTIMDQAGIASITQRMWLHTLFLREGRDDASLEVMRAALLDEEKPVAERLTLLVKKMRGR